MSSRNDNPDQETPAAAQANPLCEQPRPAALEKAEDQCSVCASIPSISGMLIVVLFYFSSLSPVSSLVEFLVPYGLRDVHFGGGCGGIRSKLFPDA